MTDLASRRDMAMTVISVGDAGEKDHKMGGAPASGAGAESPPWLKAFSAGTYAGSSFAIMAVNKEVLTVTK